MLNLPISTAALTATILDDEPSASGKGRMLGRLLKYELRATARLYFPLYLAVLILAALGRFSIFGISWGGGQVVPTAEGYDLVVSIPPQVGGPLLRLVSTAMTLVLFAYVLMVLGAFVVHFIITIQRFWKNLMGDEGYLMFTLPVSTDALLWSKAISAFIWTIATLLVVALSVLILCGHPVVFQIIKDVVLQNISNASWQRIEVLWIRAFPPSLWVLTLLAIVADGLCDVFHLYAAMSLGHTFKSHKILASVGLYMAIAMAEGTVSGFLSSALMPVVNHPLKELPVWDYMFLTLDDMALFADALGQTLRGFMLIVLVGTTLFAAVYYLVTRYILNTQLNLE